MRRLWPKLTELVGGNEPLARRRAELRDRVLIVEPALDGFAAGTRAFPDDSHLVQIDTGLFLTVFEVVQAFVEVCDPDPEVPPGQAERDLLFSCIELFEHATFVTGSQTHPPAADRWDVVRAVAKETFGTLIPNGVDELWQPMERLLADVATGDLPLTAVRATLESLKARTRFLGDVDTEVATGLIARHRHTTSRS